MKVNKPFVGFFKVAARLGSHMKTRCDATIAGIDRMLVSNVIGSFALGDKSQSNEHHHACIRLWNSWGRRV